MEIASLEKLLSWFLSAAQFLPSLNAFYAPADRVAENLDGSYALEQMVAATDPDTGVYSQTGRPIVWSFEPEYGSPGEYRLWYYSAGKSRRFAASVFELEGTRFLDLSAADPLSKDGFIGGHFFPTHSAARIGWARDGSLKVEPLDPVWLARGAGKAMAPAVSSVVEGRTLLVAETRELRKLLARAASDPAAFGKPFYLYRRGR